MHSITNCLQIHILLFRFNSALRLTESNPAIIKCVGKGPIKYMTGLD